MRARQIVLGERPESDADRSGKAVDGVVGWCYQWAGMSETM